MPTTDKKTGKGTYICKNCGTRIILDDYTGTFSACPKCHFREFYWVYKSNRKLRGIYIKM
jgi:DNA-directed RNA polymerase subunit RPC12/RpoP